MGSCESWSLQRCQSRSDVGAFEASNATVLRMFRSCAVQSRLQHRPGGRTGHFLSRVTRKVVSHTLIVRRGPGHV